MTTTNIYPMENLKDLHCRYVLYRVRGIPLDFDGYYSALQKLSQQLSIVSKSPCISLGGQDSIIAQLEGHESLPNQFPVVGGNALIEPTGKTGELRFGSLGATELPLALRFLQFDLTGSFKRNPQFWLPKSSPSVFHKVADQQFARLSNSVDMYRGFTFRFVPLSNEGIGLCLDVARKYADRRPVPATITEDDFRRYKGRTCVYEYGETWYQIKIEQRLGLNVSEATMPDGTTLYNHLKGLHWGNRLDFFASLPRDSSVFVYHTGSGEVRRVPSGLCRLAHKTDSRSVSGYHFYTILDAEKRRREIEYVIKEYFRNMIFQGTKLKLSSIPMEFERVRFEIPRLLFGNRKTLRVGSGVGNDTVSIDQWPAAKKSRLLSADSGFFSRSPFPPQYLILPESFRKSFGSLFIEHIKEQVKAVYSPTGEYEYKPAPIFYDDSIGQSVPVLGREIIRATTQHVFYSGYGLIVIPRIRQSSETTEDELANLLMKELRDRDVHVSIIHTDQALQSYVQASSEGQPYWKLTDDRKQAGRFRSYLQNLVINKILLLNGFWPFVLADPLHADVTIGIDVKNHSAGFTFILKDGQTIWSTVSDSKYRERLGGTQCGRVIYENLRQYLPRNAPVKSVVIHRDGHMFPEESDGVMSGLHQLVRDGLAFANFDIDFLEIHKTSRVPVRFFEPTSVPGSQAIEAESPFVGTHCEIGDAAFLTTTGYPYLRRGTPRPILVTKAGGGRPSDILLEDVFRLSNLTWTRVDDCSRVPLTIRITDIRLREVAGDYNPDALRFVPVEEES